MKCRRRGCPVCGDKMKLIERQHSYFWQSSRITWYCEKCEKEYVYLKTEYSGGKYLLATDINEPIG